MPTDDINTSTQYNNRPEAASECRATLHPTNKKQNDIAVIKQAENCENIETLKNAEKLNAK